MSSRRLAAPASPLAYDGTVAERVVGDGMLAKWAKWVRSVELIRSVLDPPEAKKAFFAEFPVLIILICNKIIGY